MNVRVDTNQTKENITKTQEEMRFSAGNIQQKKSELQGKTMQQGTYGFQVLQGQTFGNNAYHDGAVKSVSGEDTASAALSDVQIQKNYRLLMSATVSDEEFVQLMKEGYRPGEMTPEEIVTVVDEIKAKMAEAGVVVAGYNDDLKASQLEEITGSKANAKAILDTLKQTESLQQKEGTGSDAIWQAMKAYDLPVVKETQQQMEQAVALAGELSPLSEGSMKYLLENQLQPTFENIYLASHSGAIMPENQARGYFSEGLGYYGKKPEEVNLDELKNQIDKVIQNAGYETTESNRQSAGWMIENGLTLTEESFGRYMQLNQMEFPMDAKDAAFAAACAIKNGKKAIEAVPYETATYEQQAKELVQQVANISSAAMEKTINEGEVICIRNLYRAQQEIQANPQWLQNDAFTNAEQKSENVNAGMISNAGLQSGNISAGMISNTGLQVSQKLITVRSQIEEIRLQMTVASAARLLRNGISIDTTELSQLVEDLKLQQQQRNEVLFGTDSVEENAAKEKLWSETKDIVNEMPNMPAALVGKLSIRNSYSLNIAYEQGSMLREAYAAAGESYEALWTSPRADLGDSIMKAFRNVDDLLLENGMEVTPENEKAVRILGYNHMEINTESIVQVREANRQLTGVIAKLTPAAVLDLIRDNYNPLEMNLDELERYLDERDSDPAEELEKYSRFLVRMQENNAITKEEQESYIGIYRMLHQIEKRDGAALGAVLNQGGDITFRNLLSNARSYQGQGKEFVIDDSFGLLDQVVMKGVSITAQIASAFTGQDSSAELGLQQLRMESDISADASKLLENVGMRITLDEMAAANRLTANRGGFYRKAAEYLEDEGVQNTSNAYSDENADDNNLKADLQSILSNFDKEAAKLKKAFTDRDSALGAFQEMSTRMQSALESSIGQVNNSLDMREIALAMKQISFIGRMAERESYEIPMRLGNEITSVNVHMIHDQQKNPQVSIYSESELYGKVQATFCQTGDAFTGYIVADRKNVLKVLENKFASFKEKLTEKLSEKSTEKLSEKSTGNSIVFGNINFVQSETFQVNYLTEIADVNNKEFIKGKDLVILRKQDEMRQENITNESIPTSAEPENAETPERISTKVLYEIAREFLEIL